MRSLIWDILGSLIADSLPSQIISYFEAMPSYFVTHPEVDVDPHGRIDEWSLSDAGRARGARLASFDWVNQLGRIITSTERKAKEAGAILATLTGLACTSDVGLCENDRSATGYLPGAEFEATASEFFAHPTVSVRGWESAVEAQHRIVAAIRRLSVDTAVSTAYVAHGAVGTLLYCDLMGLPISRAHDQPGQGSYFEFDPQSWTAKHCWRRIEPHNIGP